MKAGGRTEGRVNERVNERMNERTSHFIGLMTKEQEVSKLFDKRLCVCYRSW